MTNVDMFDEIKLDEKIKKLKEEIKSLKKIEKHHKELNGKLREELHREKKDHDITKEDLQLKDIENGRLIDKLSKKKPY